MKALSILLYISLTLSSSCSFAHGEDKPGPHGGEIRMPGAFHTEVKEVESGYRVYLLDMNWKFPTVRDSSVSAFILHKKEKIELNCIKEIDSFFCKSNKVHIGELNLLTKRDGAKGNNVTYALPLTFEKSKNSKHTEH